MYQLLVPLQELYKVLIDVQKLSKFLQMCNNFRHFQSSYRRAETLDKSIELREAARITVTQRTSTVPTLPCMTFLKNSHRSIEWSCTEPSVSYISYRTIRPRYCRVPVHGTRTSKSWAGNVSCIENFGVS